MSKRYLYDSNDVLQGVFENENALHRYLNQEYTSESEDRGPSGRVLTNKTILPSVFKIERRLIHKRKEVKVVNKSTCLVITPSGDRLTFKNLKDASRQLNINYKTFFYLVDRGEVKRGMLKGYTIRRLEAA